MALPLHMAGERILLGVLGVLAIKSLPPLSKLHFAPAACSEETSAQALEQGETSTDNIQRVLRIYNDT